LSFEGQVHAETCLKMNIGCSGSAVVQNVPIDRPQCDLLLPHCAQPIRAAGPDLIELAVSTRSCL